MQTVLYRLWRNLILPLLLMGISTSTAAVPKNFITLATGEWPPYTSAESHTDREDESAARG